MIRGRAIPVLQAVVSTCISLSSGAASTGQRISGACIPALLSRRPIARLSAGAPNDYGGRNRRTGDFGTLRLPPSPCCHVGLGFSRQSEHSYRPSRRMNNSLQLILGTSFSSIGGQNFSASAGCDVAIEESTRTAGNGNMENDGRSMDSGQNQGSLSTTAPGRNKAARMCYYHSQGLCSKGEDPAHLAKFSHDFPALSVRADDLDKVKTQPFEFFLVLDLEGMVEILEFPVVMLDAKTLRVVDRFHRFVKPTKMSQARQVDYIRNKYGRWGLDRVWHDTAVPFADVLVAFESWLEQHKLWNPQERSQKLLNAAFVTCGNWDIKTKIPDQCVTSEINLPAYFNEWINLKDVYYNFYKFKASGMLPMMRGLKINMIGTHHVGLDDAHNITRVLQRMLAHGAIVKLTATREPGAPKSVKFTFRFRIK